SEGAFSFSDRQCLALPWKLLPRAQEGVRGWYRGALARVSAETVLTSIFCRGVTAIPQSEARKVCPTLKRPNCCHDKLAGTLQGFSAAPSGCLRGLMGLAPFPPSPKWANWQSKGGTLSLVCRNISES